MLGMCSSETWSFPRTFRSTSQALTPRSSKLAVRAIIRPYFCRLPERTGTGVVPGQCLLKAMMIWLMEIPTADACPSPTVATCGMLCSKDSPLGVSAGKLKLSDLMVISSNFSLWTSEILRSSPARRSEIGPSSDLLAFAYGHFKGHDDDSSLLINSPGDNEHQDQSQQDCDDLEDGHHCIADGV